MKRTSTSFGEIEPGDKFHSQKEWEENRQQVITPKRYTKRDETTATWQDNDGVFHTVVFGSSDRIRLLHFDK